jgi:quercetin dioxygenase-like cupin family protein
VILYQAESEYLLFASIFPWVFKNQTMTFMYFSNSIEKAAFSTEDPQPQNLYAQGPLKVISVGLEAGQKIPVHPEGLAVYTFMNGEGWMLINGERLPVHPGAIIITQAGALRGIEAVSRLVFLIVRIFSLSEGEIQA